MTQLIESLNSVADVWWPWMVSAFWQAAVIGLLILVLVAFAKKWSSPIRYALLLIALAKFAVPPLWSSPTGLLSHVGPVRLGDSSVVATGRSHDEPLEVAEPALHTVVVTHKPDATVPHTSPEVVNQNERSEEEPVELLIPPENDYEAATEVPANTEFSSQPVATTPKLTWKASLLLLHTLGAIAFAIWIARQLVHLRSLIQSARAASDRVHLKAVELQEQLRMRREVRLLTTSEADSPIAFGVIRPTIILPNDDYSDSDLETVLGHELAHLRRGDGWTSWLQLGLMIAWWFHPVFWMLNRTLRRVREDCCDDLLIATGLTTTDDYCDTLLRVAARSSTAPVHVACSMSGRLHPLGDRIRRIMDPSVRRAVRLSVVNFFVMAGLAVVLLPGLRTKISQAQEPTIVKQDKSFEIPDGLPVAKPRVDRFGNYGGYAVEPGPLEVSGRCVDTKGNPVPNATVRLFVPGFGERYYNKDGKRQELKGQVGIVQSDADGRFTIKTDQFPIKEFKPGPVAKPRESSFVLVGAADAKGLSSPGVRTLRYTTRPDSLDPDEQMTLFFEGEPIEVELLFRDEVRIHGIVRDDVGQPLEGATVQLGHVRRARQPWGQEPRTHSYRPQNPKKNREADLGRSLMDMPKKYRTATTNENGEYEIRGFPANARALIAAFVTPDFQRHDSSIVSATGKSRSYDSFVGLTGKYDITLVRPRAVSIRTKAESLAKPKCQVRVEPTDPRKVRHLGPGSIAVTENGVATLALPPGKYRVIVEPFAGQKLLPSVEEFEVTDELEQSAEFTLQQAVSVAIRAIVQGSNEAVEGVGFSHKRKADDKPRLLQSQPGFVDHPRTDHTGVVRATVPAGTHLLTPTTIPAGYQRATTDEIEVNVEAGAQKIIQVTFTKDEATPSDVPDQLAELAELCARQSKLLSRGRYVYRRNNFVRGDLQPDEMRRVMEELEGKSADHAEAILKHVFPNTGFSRQIMIVDHHKMAQAYDEDGHFPWQGLMVSTVNVENGVEQLRYSSDNAQLDVANVRGSRVHVGAFRELVQIAPVESLPPGLNISIDGDKTLLKLGEGDTLATLVLDTATGFLHEMSRMRGGSGQVLRQYSPVKHESGAMTPLFRVEARFRNNKLDRADITFIDTAKIVSTFPPGTFSLGVPVGTNVLDYRGMNQNQLGSRPSTGALNAPVTDVVAYVNARRERVLAAAKARAPRQPGPMVGAKSPPLQVAGWYDQNGKTDAPDLEAGPVILNFYAGPLSNQRKDMRTIRAAYSELTKRSVIVVNVYPPTMDAKKVSEFMKQYKLPWKFAIDSPIPGRERTGKTFAAFRTSASTVLLNSGNILQSLRHSRKAEAAIERMLRINPVD